jgi:hypothetical protein
MLADLCQHRHVPEPSGLWCEKVMQAIRGEQGSPQVIRFRAEARMAWRGALATAAAAVIVAAAGLWVMPSDAQLAWDLQQDSVLSAWVLQTGE